LFECIDRQTYDSCCMVIINLWYWMVCNSLRKFLCS